jgi:hypothetical protein
VNNTEQDYQLYEAVRNQCTALLAVITQCTASPTDIPPEIQADAEQCFEFELETSHLLFI